MYLVIAIVFAAGIVLSFRRRARWTPLPKIRTMGDDPFPFSEPRSFPEPDGPFSDDEAHQLLRQYDRDPTDLFCPRCRKDGTIEVLAFIVPEVSDEGFATECQPEGNYAAAVYCHGCKSAIGLRVGAFR